MTADSASTVSLSTLGTRCGAKDSSLFRFSERLLQEPRNEGLGAIEVLNVLTSGRTGRQMGMAIFAHVFGWQIGDDPDKITKAFKQMRKTRNRAIYVDWDDDGKQFLDPLSASAKEISQEVERARRVVAIAREHLKKTEEFFGR